VAAPPCAANSENATSEMVIFAGKDASRESMTDVWTLYNMDEWAPTTPTFQSDADSTLFYSRHRHGQCPLYVSVFCFYLLVHSFILRLF
jgi:hypothetical protein